MRREKCQEWQPRQKAGVRLPAPLLVILATALVAGCSGGPETARYEVSIGFNNSVTAAGVEEVREFLGQFDSGADVRVLDLQPPIIQATVDTAREDVCEQVLGLLFQRDDVANADCDEAA
jgi:hypothetical protein